MKGQVSLKTGRYPLDAGVTLFVRLCDSGVIIAAEDHEARTRYLAIIDEEGKLVMPLVRREVPASQSLDAPKRDDVESEPSLARPAARRRASLPIKGLKTDAVHSKMKFTLKHKRTKGRQSKNVCYVIGAFMLNGLSMAVLYRVIAGKIVYYEQQVLIEGERVRRFNDIPSQFRIPDNRWDEFLVLPENGIREFQGQHWRRMISDEIKDRIAGRVFQESGPP